MWLVRCDNMSRAFDKRTCFFLLLASAYIVFFLWSQRSPELPPFICPDVKIEEGTLKREDLTREKPWFMSEGTLMPTHLPIGAKSGLWPVEALTRNDRIVDQLMFLPPLYPQDDKVKKEKIILLYTGVSSWWELKTGSIPFRYCPVTTCTLTTTRTESINAAAIVYRDEFAFPGHRHINNQVWIIHHSECPFHTPIVQMRYKRLFNWTSTYRLDSDIVNPYGKFVYYDPQVRQRSKPLRNYAAYKTKKVAWFVSNCNANNGRLEYARALQKYIDVDIIGECGDIKCPRTDESMCFNYLKYSYKFYLAFENSNCKDYITEKFFWNSLGHDVLPIVMGAPREDYEVVAPEKSFIHVDDFDSPRLLADYLHFLDKNDDAYNAFFLWKGLGQFIETSYFCRLCAMLHDDIPVKFYEDINAWWRGPGICNKTKLTFS